MDSTRVGKVVAVAAAALGRPLTDPVALADEPGWTVVLRCTSTRPQAARVDAGDPGESVVVKAYPPTAAGAGCFAAEVAGLRLVGDSGLAPLVLAVAPEALTVVMSDLGTGPSLADALLGDFAETAATALLDWATACGRLSVLGHGRRAELDDLRARYLAGQPDLRHITGLPGRVLGAAAQAGRLGVPAPAGLAAELAEVAAATSSAGPAVFSPGDICPDNNMLTSAGIRLFDFEEAGFHPVFLDAAYIRMPFATCWCVFRLPGWLADAAESAYRTQVGQAWPGLADDDAWRPGVRLAVAAWTLSATSWLLRRSLTADEPMHPARPSPRSRALLRFRWAVLAGELEQASELPAVAELMRRLLAVTDRWQVPELPVYPAFRPR